jgi:agmatinase
VAAPSPGGFLGLPAELQDPGRARVVVLPIPYEATVSWGSGTGAGPQAIIGASQQVELYDGRTDDEPALRWGVHTLPALPCDFPSGDAMMEGIAAAAAPHASARKLLLSLGGEHSISPAIVRGVLRARPAPLTVVQIDAHADLRDSYEGDRYSHACAMRRILEENSGPAVQLGVRSWSLEEARFMREAGDRLSVFSMDRVRRTGWDDLLREVRGLVEGRDVYLTIDVDGLDPSVIPATGTPEPGGLAWAQALDLVTLVASESRLVALDCVELAPVPGLAMAEFAAARLLYAALSAALRD